MATRNGWDRVSYAINYACANFDAGVSIAEIHRSLSLRKFPDLDLATVQEWLRANGRTLSIVAVQDTSSHYPNLRPAPNSACLMVAGSPPDSNPLDKCTAGISNWPDYDQTARHQLPIGSNYCRAELGSTPTIPKNSRSVPWDAEADKLAIDAYSEEKCIDLIREELGLHGYDATQSDIVRSLYSQGIRSFNIKIRKD